VAELLVEVDPDLCIGSAECTRVAARAFRLDDDAGVSVPLPGALETDVTTLVEAAAGCPTNAIRVVRDGTVLFESAGRR
jgi:ferredoxin